MSQQHNEPNDEPISTGQSSQEPAEGAENSGEQESEAPQGQSSEQPVTG